MTQLKDVILIAWICSFFAPLLAGPIDKDTPHEPVQVTLYSKSMLHEIFVLKNQKIYKRYKITFVKKRLAYSYSSSFHL